MAYFHEQDSILRTSAGRIEDILAAVADRFIGAHPKRPPVYRAFCRNGFLRHEDCRYEMDLGARFPDMRDGQFVYVWGKLWSDQESELSFSVSCYSPVRIFIQDELAFQSNLNDDVFPDRRTGFRARMRRGWNHFVLEFVKTGTGCGGRFGTGSVKGAPLHFLAPVSEREGQEGWIFSEPQPGPWIAGGTAFGDEGISEADTAVRWLPDLQWPQSALAEGCFARMYGGSPGTQALAWSKLVASGIEPLDVDLKGTYDGPFALYLNGREIYRTDADCGQFTVPVRLPYGEHDLAAVSSCRSSVWGFGMEDPSAEGRVRLRQPYPVEGWHGEWLYLGPFADGTAPKPSQVTRVDTLFGEGEDAVFWRIDLPETFVRPYLENPMFGRWNYPLGVTLYGILETGKQLGTGRYVDYAADHVGQCTALAAYSEWDRSRYGAPGTNHQLTMIDSLDDCGSFGAAMLQAVKARMLPGAEAAAEKIARYITAVQDRLPDGALYRTRGTTDFMKDTMWCDDLYMSTPFLCRYYELTGETSYLDDAAAQFLLYRKRLFMPDRQIMHHVYDYKFGKPNGVAWGRGNGWVLFSLTEVLEVMPEHHRLRADLLSFFRELCNGYMRLQGENGLWHQVLTDPDSYEEASCTSMFIYAFARGIRFGWLKDPQPYADAALKGWLGLARYCIDKNGNVYGVCRGSGYSFSALYYKDQLSWQLNDTHGIGIVLLAGIEMLRMREHMTDRTASDKPVTNGVT